MVNCSVTPVVFGTTGFIGTLRPAIIVLWPDTPFKAPVTPSRVEPRHVAIAGDINIGDFVRDNVDRK